LKNVLKLSSTSNILCFQETKLKPFERNALRLLLRGWGLFFSNSPLTPKGRCHAGLLVCVSPVFLTAYSIVQKDLGINCYGHTQVLDFTPNSSNPELSPFCITNLYLATGDNQDSRKINQLKPLLNLRKEVRTILCGDFNFIEHADDSLGEGNFLSSEASDVWNSVLDHLGLYEIHQPIHTFLRPSEDFKSTVSSRLDRFYINFPESDHTVYTPSTFLPSIPYNAITTLKSKRKTHSTHNHSEHPPPSSSDHHPISLTFHSTAPSRRCKRPFSIPRWMPPTAIFQDFVRLRFRNRDLSLDNPFETNRDFKEILCKAKSHFFRYPRPTYATSAQELPGAIRLLRIFNQRSRNIDAINKITNASPTLANLIAHSLDQHARYNVASTIANISSFINKQFNLLNIKSTQPFSPLDHTKPQESSCPPCDPPYQEDEDINNC